MVSRPCGGSPETTTWTVPGERRQARREHGVPLSGRAIEILSQVRELVGEDRGVLFPTGRRWEPSSDMTYTALLRRLVFSVNYFCRLAHQFQALAHETV